jgi:hypothetical protein
LNHPLFFFEIVRPLCEDQDLSGTFQKSILDPDPVAPDLERNAEVEFENRISTCTS